MEYREASISDHLQIAKLHAKSWKENYKGLVSDEYLESEVDNERLSIWQSRLDNPVPNQYVLLAYEAEQLAGFICVYGKNNEVYGSIIDNLHVNSTFKGKGIGTKLIAQASSWLQKHYADSGVYLEVLAENPKAIGFYEFIGGDREKSGIWNTPCGNKVKEYIYTWSSPQALSAL